MLIFILTKPIYTSYSNHFTSGLNKNINLSLPSWQPALQFYLPEASLNKLKVQSKVKQAMKSFLPCLPIGQVTEEICFPDRGSLLPQTFGQGFVDPCKCCTSSM